MAQPYGPKAGRRNTAKNDAQASAGFDTVTEYTRKVHGFAWKTAFLQ
jgi:hypothetical protein